MSVDYRDNLGFVTPPGDKRKYPKGHRHPMTAEFKQQIIDKLDEIGKSREWLEDAIHCSKGVVTRLLKPDQYASKLVPSICEVLGITMPVISLEGEDEHVLLLAFRRLSQRKRRHLMESAEMLADSDSESDE